MPKNMLNFWRNIKKYQEVDKILNLIIPAKSLFRGSSMVEQLAVNQLVAGSSPARGARLDSLSSSI